MANTYRVRLRVRLSDGLTYHTSQIVDAENSADAAFKAENRTKKHGGPLMIHATVTFTGCTIRCEALKASDGERCTKFGADYRCHLHAR